MHGRNHPVDSPLGIGLAKTKRMSDGKKQKQNRGDAIEDVRFQALLQRFVTALIWVAEILSRKIAVLATNYP